MSSEKRIPYPHGLGDLDWSAMLGPAFPVFSRLGVWSRAAGALPEDWWALFYALRGRIDWSGPGTPSETDSLHGLPLQEAVTASYTIYRQILAPPSKRPPEPTPAERLQLIAELYEVFYRAVGSFEEDWIGVHLAHLTGQIAKGGKWEVTPGGEIDEVFYTKLQELFPVGHRVWSYVKIEE